MPGPAWLFWKNDDGGSSISSGLMAKLYHILCDDSTGCKNVGENDDFHRSRHNDKCVMRFTQMKISFEYLHKTEKYIELSCLNVKLYFLFLFLYLALYGNILGNMSKSLLKTSVTIVHGIDNQK